MGTLVNPKKSLCEGWQRGVSPEHHSICWDIKEQQGVSKTSPQEGEQSCMGDTAVRINRQVKHRCEKSLG